VAQAIVAGLSQPEVHVLLRVSPREICGAQNDSGESFHSSTSVPSIKIIPKIPRSQVNTSVIRRTSGRNVVLKNKLTRLRRGASGRGIRVLSQYFI
jgi:hypothetical protein